MAPNILKSSLENASFNIIFQILCRGVTFVLNAFVVRHVGQAVLGVMNVRLLLLESMILFLSKEPFMKACLTNTAEHNWAQVINLLWITVPICVGMSFIFGYIWLNVLQTSEILPPYYNFAVVAVAVSCVIELSSLVIQLIASAFLFVRLRIVLDTIMIALRTITFVFLILYNPENALLAFGVAQLVAAIFYTTSLYVYFHIYIKRLKRHKLKRRMSVSDDGVEEYIESEFPFVTIKEFLPGQLENSDSYLDRKLTILTWSFFKQGILKQVLTEGERLIMTILPVLTFSEQGIYEVVNNLGSLAARFIFRPIEESSYFYFTQMIQRDRPISRQNPAKIQESSNVLRHLCGGVTSIGLIVLVFGQSYSSLLLWLYGGEKLIDDLPVLLLRAHCLAVLLLGINGVTEGYTNATADSDTINKNNLIMIYESIAFLGASYVFATWFGPVGFIFGNCVNMILRIVHSVMFIDRRYKETSYKPLLGLVPKSLFAGSLIVAALVTSISQAYYFSEDKFLHLFIGVIMFIIVASSWAYDNYDLLKVGFNKWLERRDSDVKEE
ncbi:protein RFT1 homolog [Trichogramma pretiosum]|uniref:protein RFT1 homolog n=1 Tax=Trichogramma pretiosum TaxID=7493 RepID=UPI0006C9AD56|nr:protein RFT1 homolog [Trichogramma pretiosum]